MIDLTAEEWELVGDALGYYQQGHCCGPESHTEEAQRAMRLRERIEMALEDEPPGRESVELRAERRRDF